MQEVFIFANSLIDIRPSQLDWDSSKSLDTPIIPKVLSKPFQIVQHVGVITIPSGVCSDESRTLIDKLAEGTVYHHHGTYSSLSISGPGRKISKRSLKIIRAMEHVGTTRMCIPELDHLSQELHRVDQVPDVLPRYRTVFWNCHDYAVHFAILAVDQFPPKPALVELSVTIENSKSAFCRKHEECVIGMMLLALCVGSCSCIFDLFGYTWAHRFILLALLSTTLCNIYYTLWRFQQIEALEKREAWLRVLEERFPRLSAFRLRNVAGLFTIRENLWFPRF
ncbi:hypothetical protein ETB97_003242 [Aspergillus alliaceus]|uniref:Uncharacterized protein n=1 Tax=Petromyces alliaceus TaxID=209559 RepID=A0A5N6FLS0_PETAA|nr:uncharacterized protein BDW43DRAFT_313681 [Aspergillus alliaceus]KAB8230881.1 hypothetical protein BDW43DRAFT_313681 [Aspergillus alliaceus]KAF5859150.1 hypothetical protein ETB97_003242 [Aspergillus burnettii]